MAGGQEFPAYLTLRTKSDGSAKATFLAEINEALAPAEQRLAKFSTEAQRLLDSALSIKRNEAGSLDLGVDQLKAAAAAQQSRATAAREVAAATRLAAKEIGDEGRQARLAVAATEALAIEEERAARAAMSHAQAAEQVQERLNRQKSATDAVVASTRAGTTAYGLGTNSVRGHRTAMIQLGQQMQDMVVQTQMGTSAVTIFTQQVPQAAFALSGLGGKVGAVARFLAGPWGAAVFIATAVLGPFIANLFKSGDAADKGGSAMDKLANKLDLSKNSYELLNAVVEEYNKAQSKSTALTYDAIIATEDEARALLKVARAKLAVVQASDPTLNATSALDAIGAESGKGGLVSYLQKQIGTLEGQLANANIAASTERARVRADPRAGIETAYDSQTVRVQEMRRKGEISEKQLDLATTALAKARKGALKAYDDANRSSKSSSSGLYGAEIDMAGAKRIAKGAGFQVNSGTRPTWIRDEKPGGGSSQERLYNKWIAEGRPKDNPTAKPGTSAHERGNALDIQFGDGVNPQSMKKAFADEGVRLTKILKERGHYHIEWSTKGADKATREADRIADRAEKAREALQQFGDQSAEKIQRINERFDEQPRLIDAAAAATRELDATIKELRAADPDGKNPFFQQLIADAQAAKAAVEDALVRPFRELEENSQKRIQSRRLIVMGRDEEAEALSIIWSLEERLGPLSENRKNQVRETVRHEREAMEALRGHKEIMDAYLGAVSSARSELEAILSGTGKIANFQTIFKQLRGKVLTELIFGPALRSLEEFTKKNVFGESVDKLAETTTYASDTVMDFADAVAGASRKILASQSPTLSAGLNGAGSGLGSLYAGLTGGGANDNDIVVMGQKFGDKRGARPDLSPEQFIDKLSTSIIKPMLAGFDDIFGTTFFSKMSGALSGALSGFTTAGVPGGILGLLQGITKDGSKLDGKLGDALKGAQTGSLVAGIGGAFGIKLNETGAQAGGAIGKLLKSIPGGDIIGAIAGGLIGNLFGKRKRGGASVSNDTVYAHANDSAVTDSLNSSGSSLQDAIKNIANAFGTTVGSYDVGLGRYKDYYQVSSSGSDPKLGNSYFGRDSKNSLYDGLDADAAMRAAVLAALQDGAIQGIKAGAQRLLLAGKDLDVQIQKALDFQGVFDKLRAIKDPVGAALDALDKEFKRLRDIFAEAGASTQEYAQLEELYGMERAKAIKAAQDQITGSLRALYEQLTIGDSGLSLRSRLGSAQAAYDPLKARVAAGDVTAYDDFAAAAQTLLDLQRQIYGSQTPYFDLLAEITGLTKTQLDAQAAIADASAGRDNPLSAIGGGTAANDNTNVVGAIGTSNDILNQININIANLGNLLLTGTGGSGGGSSGFLPRNEAEYFF